MAGFNDFLLKQFSTPIVKSASDMPSIELNTKEEKWIWVDGFKGTDRNMCCRDYQYELGKQFDMPEDAEIEDCVSGFHLCKDLNDVFDYYSIGVGNRYFAVRALVREKDYKEYGVRQNVMWSLTPSRDKLAAKSIEFIRELSVEEIFNGLKNPDTSDWTTEEKEEALCDGLEVIINRRREERNKQRLEELVSLGYSRAFAGYLIENDKYDSAVAVASQPELSMDMKCLIIFRHDL